MKRVYDKNLTAPQPAGSILDTEGWYVPSEPFSGWQHVAAVMLIKQHRKGWMGVWEALCSALFGSPRIVVAKPVTVSVWVHADVEVDNVLMIASPIGHICVEDSHSYETYVNGVQVNKKEDDVKPE